MLKLKINLQANITVKREGIIYQNYQKLYFTQPKIRILELEGVT
jgi:hypothetical protein